MVNFNSNLTNLIAKTNRWLDQARSEGPNQEKLKKLLDRLEKICEEPELKNQKNEITSLIHRISGQNGTELKSGVEKIKAILKTTLEKTTQPEELTFSPALPPLKIEDVRGHLWEPVKMERDPNSESGGMLLTFRLKDEFNPFTNSNYAKTILKGLMEVYPATEGYPISLVSIVPNLTEDKCIDIYKNFNKQFFKIYQGLDEEEDGYDEVPSMEVSSHEIYGSTCNELGYTLSKEGKDFILTLPDLNLLLERWKKLQVTRPHLLDLKIKYGSEEIEPHLDFVKAFIKEPGAVECIISRGKEFAHDQTMHVLSLLARLIIIEKICIDKDYAEDVEFKIEGNEGPKEAYTNQLSRFREALLERYELILTATQLPNKTAEIDRAIGIATYSMGVLIDVVTASKDVSVFESSLSLESLDEIKDDEKEYYKKEYGAYAPYSIDLKKVWEELRAFVEQNGA